MKGLIILQNLILILIVSNEFVRADEEKQETEGLKIETTKPVEDCPRKAKNDDQVSVHYTGYLTSGKEFDSSRKRNQPFVIILGRGMVIPGWEKGLQGMCVGEQRKLVIPPELAYGEQGIGELIPGGSTLVFDVEMLEISDAPEQAKQEQGDNEQTQDEAEQIPQDELFAQIDTDGDKQINVEEMANHIKKHEGKALGEDVDVYTMVGEIFQEDDKNKDGVISYDEFITQPSVPHEEL